MLRPIFGTAVVCTHLLEGDDIWVIERPVIDDLPLNILVNLWGVAN